MTNQRIEVTRMSVNNQPETATDKFVDGVVVNNVVVADIREVNPGVIINKQ